MSVPVAMAAMVVFLAAGFVVGRVISYDKAWLRGYVEGYDDRDEEWDAMREQVRLYQERRGRGET